MIYRLYLLLIKITLIITKKFFKRKRKMIAVCSQDMLNFINNWSKGVVLNRITAPNVVNATLVDSTVTPAVYIFVQAINNPDPFNANRYPIRYSYNVTNEQYTPHYSQFFTIISYELWLKNANSTWNT